MLLTLSWRQHSDSVTFSSYTSVGGHLTYMWCPAPAWCFWWREAFWGAWPQVHCPSCASCTERRGGLDQSVPITEKTERRGKLGQVSQQWQRFQDHEMREKNPKTWLIRFFLDKRFLFSLLNRRCLKRKGLSRPNKSSFETATVWLNKRIKTNYCKSEPDIWRVL